MKALRWIIILVNGLKVDGNAEISFVGKLIEEKNPDINFEDLSYISHQELNNQDNIFNVEVVSGVLTTTIPAPSEALESEENALTFVEDYYSLLLDDKEYEIGFDHFSENGIEGFLFYLSPDEPSVTTRTMVQQVKGGKKVKLPSLERNQADITSRINSENLGSVTHEIVLDPNITQAYKNNEAISSSEIITEEHSNTKEEHSDWNSFVDAISTPDEEGNAEKENNNDKFQNQITDDIQKEKTEHAEWSSFIQDVSDQEVPEKEESIKSEPVGNQPENPEWNSFIEDVTDQEIESEVISENTKKIDMKHIDWDSFMESETPQKTETMTTPINVTNERSQTVYKNPPTRRLKIPPISDASKGEWNQFLGNLNDEEVKEEKKLTESEIFPGNIQKTEQKKSFSVKNKTSRYAKESISPTPVPFTNKTANATKFYVGNTENTPKKRTTSFPPVVAEKKVVIAQKSPDVTFDDKVKIKANKRPKKKQKKSFFRKLITFVFFLILLSGGGFTYLWYEQPLIAQDILKQSQKYINIVMKKIDELKNNNAKNKSDNNYVANLESELAKTPNTDIKNLTKIIDFEKKNGKSLELSKIKNVYINKIKKLLNKKINLQKQKLVPFEFAFKPLDKYQKIALSTPELKSTYENAQKDFKNKTKKLADIAKIYAQKKIVNDSIFKGVSFFNKKKVKFLFSKKCSDKDYKKAKEKLLLLFVKKYKKNTIKGVILLQKALKNKKINNKDIQTENVIIHLLYKLIQKNLRKKNYRQALNYIDKSKALKISKSINEILKKWRKDITLEKLFWKDLDEGLKKISLRKNVILEYKIKSKLLKINFTSNWRYFRKKIIHDKKNYQVDPWFLSVESLKKILDQVSNDSEEEKYYKIFLFLSTHKRSNHVDALRKTNINTKKKLAEIAIREGYFLSNTKK